MGARAVSPGAALLRSSRMFSMPKPLPEPQTTNSGGNKSATMTRPYPQSQAITSPLSSREKGDWGFKRPFPLKSTLTSSTPLIRIKKVDAVENVTDFISAADYTISLEKFQEMRVALSVPRYDPTDGNKKLSLWFKSVFEEHQDFTYLKHADNKERVIKKGTGSSQDDSQKLDQWFASIFEECTGSTYPKPADQQEGTFEQGGNSADLARADPEHGQLVEGQDSADLARAGPEDGQLMEGQDSADLARAGPEDGQLVERQDSADLGGTGQEGVPTKEMEGMNSAGLGPTPEQVEEDTKPAVQEPADQRQASHEQGMDSADPRGVDLPDVALDEFTQPAALEPADQQQAMLDKSGDDLAETPDPRAGATGKPAASPNVDTADKQVVDLFKRRWKFQGPWLARMTQGEFNKYIEKQVRPRRAEFRVLLMDKLAKELTANRNNDAFERGLPPSPRRIEPKDITKKQFTEFLRMMRYDRTMLYDLISRFLDMAPLGHPFSGVVESVQSRQSSQDGSPYEIAGPPPSHPSAGISYLRTNAFMDNHPVYGPQEHRTPVLARVVSPRIGATRAKLGLGGFVGFTPGGDSSFNMRHGRSRTNESKTFLAGITYLDTTTYGGAKAYVAPHTASIDPSGRIVLQLRETGEEAPLILKELDGSCTLYNDKVLERFMPREAPAPREQATVRVSSRFQAEKLADEIMGKFMPRGSPYQSEVNDDSETARV
ncbi:hypothetical protein G6O67_000115 [Ophiocordyceps sinensis]|uniref:Uncharacterized protein n=2 Tax=Ophiocordyceps sinensis TaxID=72228 RepID=A0A8H4PYN0_9HYPO|nr:hypothetical protein G6O67_000115 [Ophiocordyceps sinensis]